MVRLVGLALTGLLVAFQLWYANAPRSQRELVPDWVRVGADSTGRAIYEVYDSLNDTVGPHVKHGWAQTKMSLGLMRKPEKPRVGMMAVHADLSEQSFVAQRLSEATMLDANLDGSDFSKTYLRRAMMDRVSARGTTFDGAILELVSLKHADLTGASFAKADLSGAVLEGARLDGADLRHAVGLTQIQVAAACGDETTRLPDGMKLRSCDKSVSLR